MTDIPIVLTQAGRTNTPPSTLRDQLVALVSATNPGYTADLPGSLIEDIASTDVGALTLIDQAVTETIDSITPYGANAWLLTQLGNVYGVAQGASTNTSVYVVFTGTVGYVIPQGMTISDGVHQYLVQDGGVIASGGSSSPLYCVAIDSGSWAVPASTVTTIITSVPSSITLSVTNPQPGIPSAGAETEGQYRARVLQAGLSVCTGLTNTLKNSLTSVAGVQPRLVSVLQSSPGWEVIVGGGDPYEVANAIFNSVGDISLLVGSSTTARNITADLYDYPNTYSVVFVSPVDQVVTVSLTWNTIATNYVAPASVSQLGNPAIASYINGLPVGQPINEFELQTVFQQAIASIVPPQLLSRMVWAFTVNSTPVSPSSGTGLIPSDPEGYFTVTTAAITIAQG